MTKQITITDFEMKARMAMLQKGITFTSLAKELGVSATYVWDIVKGTRPGTGQKEKIAEILEIEI